MILQIPNGWKPRPYQMELWSALEAGKRRACVVAHRRWGKDETALHWTAVSAMEKPATYWHLLPIYAQARKAIWQAINPHTGLRRIDEAFPLAIRENTNDDEMFIRFKNGATWQVIGSDNYNSLVGSPPYGLVFSEWALADPAAWAYLSPILAENGGWALFIYTARGKNHGWSLYQNARKSPDWITVRQTADDTGVFTPGALKAARDEYAAIYGEDEGDALFQQEFYCSFDAAILGAYYGREFVRLEQAKRICSVPHDPSIPVYTGWDLGLDDATAVWFAQAVGNEIRIIDYYEVNNQSLNDTVRYIHNEKRYNYEAHFLPHDIRVRELTTGKSRLETLASLGMRNIIVTPASSKEDQINAVRNFLPRCWFDEIKTEKGVNALRQFRREWDEKLRTYRQRPLHDWSSHGADGFATIAMNFDPRHSYDEDDDDREANYTRSATTGY